MKELLENFEKSHPLEKLIVECLGVNVFDVVSHRILGKLVVKKILERLHRRMSEIHLQCTKQQRLEASPDDQTPQQKDQENESRIGPSWRVRLTAAQEDVQEVHRR